MKCERIACDAPATRRVVTYWSDEPKSESLLCSHHAILEKAWGLNEERVLSCFSNLMKEAA